MRMIFHLGGGAVLVASAAFATSASAALEIGINYYSALPQDQIALNEYTAAPGCTPAEAHYLPSFIRAPDGTIIGVGYVEMENDSGC
ncbi:hypothetical protein [Rhizobium sullae]|uniref:Uncharacterized protein n=1 Tax=Rhizobium sullae TaxID=50338 RepID=A0A2N0D3X4_RHISU|nr:hypothetical protein [Rhizobium sullae]PKA40815.1 hypothetical protein CWR43_24430 [Rhizobium sullae]TCU17909.1 hypothetical protein EV132_10325 [Rhizobium sullae]UWU14654.1 hypothetical protein N2599_01040 [Rhizobium sullae]